MATTSRRAASVETGEANGVLLFASSQDEARARRPTDVALAFVSLVLVIVCSVLSEIGGELERELAELLASFPGLLEPLWGAMAWAPLAWALVLVVAAVARGRRALARDLVAGAATSIAVALVVAAIVTNDASSVVTRLADVDGPPLFPPGALTCATAVIATASPHLGRPFRHLGRWLVVGQLVASLFLGASLLTGAVAAVGAGLLSAALVHLAVGSPGGRPTTSRIVLALRGLGVAVNELAPAAMHREGVVLFEGTDAIGPLAVKVYGRDAWDGQLLSNLWRLAWYRGTERTVGLSRIELVEHEGFITLLADRAGVRVPHLVTAGSAGRGDALVVVRPEGTPLSAGHATTTVDGVASLWIDLARLHRGGIAHRRLDLDRLVARLDGSIGFGDLSSASVTDSPADPRHDWAQALVVTLLLVGEAAAAALGRHELGDDELREVLPYVQEAAMPPLVRERMVEADIELDEVRARLGTLLGASEQPLVKLRRVTWGSVLNLALLALAAYTLIGLFSGLDLDTFADELVDARWWWLAFALLLAQLARIPSALSTMGSLQQALPFGPLAAMQFAICYVNLAIPSTAARVAINVRFLQRLGVRPTTAISAGVIDSVSGFIVQVALFVSLFFASDLDLELSSDTGEIGGLATTALIVIVALVVVAGCVVALVPAIRQRVVAQARDALGALGVLRTPAKVLELFGGNLLSQVMFGIALSACVYGFGEEVPLGTLVLINTVVSLFAGLLPVPGGIGVSEAGLTLGLTAAGLSSETAFATALAYRFVSFYLPPIWGWFCYQWLVRRQYL
jgi:uncharacterized membrane protein YbhN (UPF0104 family)